MSVRNRKNLKIKKDDDGKKNKIKNISKAKEFGLLMAKEGKTSHIPTITNLYLFSICFYSLFVSYVTDCFWYTIILYYIASMLCFYFWHWLAHQKWTGPMYRAHMRHHLEIFPPKNFYGKDGIIIKETGYECPTLLQLCSPFASTTVNPYHEGPLFVLFGLILWSSIYICESTPLTILFLTILIAIIGLVGSAIHYSFHIKGFELEKYEWYLELRTLHYLHHLGNMQSNFAMVNVGIDYFFDSYSRDLEQTIHNIRPLRKKGINYILDEREKQEMFAISGIMTALLGFDLYLTQDSYKRQKPTYQRGVSVIILSMVLSSIGILIYFFSKKVLQHGFILENEKIEMFDHGHEFVKEYTTQFLPYANLCEYISLILTDFSIIFFIVHGLLGDTYRPFVTGYCALFIRLIYAYFTRFSTPTSLLDEHIVGSYIFYFLHDAYDYYCMRVAIIYILRRELSHISYTWNSSWIVSLLSLFTLIYAIFFALIFNTNWTFEILTSILIAHYSCQFGEKWSILVDALMP